MKKTLILGATSNPARYAHLAAISLVAHGHPIINVGIHLGEAAGQPIEMPNIIHNDIDTITLYVNPTNQKEYYNYILAIKPARIIFNPGTENADLAILAKANGILVEETCTLVMLSTGQY
jgi:predicted CoA-binding protein